MTKTFDWKKTLTNIVLPVLVTVGIIYIFFKDISLNDIKTGFLRIPLSYLLAFVILSMAATLLRALKYHILLSKKLKFFDVFLITLVRNFSVDLLPARTASLVFYSWLTKKKGIALEEGASSFVVSVFYDGFALSVMLGSLVFFLDTGMDRRAMYAGMGIIFVISVTAIFFAEPILRFILKFKPLHRFAKLTRFFQNVADYLSQHKSPGERLYVFFLSLVIRLLKYVFVYILFEGIVHLGFSLENFALFSFGLAGTELSALLPIQGLGGFGTWELAFAVIFKALAIPAANIKAAGFVIHITTQVWEYFIGLIAFGYLFVKKNERSELRAKG